MSTNKALAWKSDSPAQQALTRMFTDGEIDGDDKPKVVWDAHDMFQ